MAFVPYFFLHNSCDSLLVECETSYLVRIAEYDFSDQRKQCFKAIILPYSFYGLMMSTCWIIYYLNLSR